MLVREKSNPLSAIAIVVALVILAAILLLLFQSHASAPRKQVEQHSVPRVQKMPEPAQESEIKKPTIPTAETTHPAVAVIATNDLSRAVRTEVERLTRPNPVALAVFDDGTKRLACLLVDNPGHYFQLDHSLQSDHFAALDSGLFQAPTEPIAKSISRYRSVAKKAMNYRATGEDRLIILLCPHTEWPALDLTYRNYAPGPLPGTLEETPKSQF